MTRPRPEFALPLAAIGVLLAIGVSSLLRGGILVGWGCLGAALAVGVCFASTLPGRDGSTGSALARGYRVAGMTLALELLLALGLLSDAVAIFSMLAMVLAGAAWLPAGAMILAGLRAEAGEVAALPALVVGIACVLVGGMCLLTFGKWVLMSVAMA